MFPVVSDNPTPKNIPKNLARMKQKQTLQPFFNSHFPTFSTVQAKSQEPNHTLSANAITASIAVFFSFFHQNHNFAVSRPLSVGTRQPSISF
jgi:hypothetical protein